MSESWKPDFPNWKDRFPDLIWWLDVTRTKLPRGTVDVAMRPLLDNTTKEVWHMRVDSRGLPMGPVVQGERLLGETEVKYEQWQYSLIVWCLQKILFEGWIIRECYDVIKFFWKNLPGQPPLTSRSVTTWWLAHCRFKKQGMLWP